jgi:hypothetical protein
VNGRSDTRTHGMASASWRRFAWILILIADAGFVGWGAMAALVPGSLPGPNGVPILVAGYEGFSRGSWTELVTAAPMTAKYIVLLFRLYGVFCLVFGVMAIAIDVTAFRRGEGWAWWALFVGNTIAFVSAMTYDRIANAIGPFELTEYLGLAIVYGALAIAAPGLSAKRFIRLLHPQR